VAQTLYAHMDKQIKKTKQNKKTSKTLIPSNAGKNAEPQELSFVAYGNKKWYS
jgi:hypothetical protein